MASVFSHAVVAVTVGATYAALQPHVGGGTTSGPAPLPTRFWIFSIVCAVIPDLDVLGMGLGIPYESMWGHRGITHSLTFAFALAAMVVSSGFQESHTFSTGWWVLVLYFFAVTGSHAVLDAMTTGGLGIAFFAPFHNTRYFFPWRPIEVSPIGIREFFTARGIQVLASELLWIWTPSAMWLLALWGFRRAS